MRQHQETLEIETNGQGLVELTGDAARIVKATGIRSGLVHIFCRHTSASLLIQENADPTSSATCSPFSSAWFRTAIRSSCTERKVPDDMPAHVKSALTQTTLTIPIADGRMMLGTWQGIYLFEHRRRPHTRQVVVHVIGE